MIAINYSTARQNLKDVCDRAVENCEPVIITRERGENVVLISEDNYNNMLENLYVRSDPEYYQELMQSIAQLKAGKGKVRELIEDE